MKGNRRVRISIKDELYGEFANLLSPSERWVWLALRLFCANSPLQPYIALTMEHRKVGFTDTSIAEYLSIDSRLWATCKHKFINYKLIELQEDNIIKIRHWHKWKQISWVEKSENPEDDLLVDKNKVEKERRMTELRKAVIDHLNMRTGKHFHVGAIPSIEFINGRTQEGATLTDFKHVIDVKSLQWRGDEYWDKFLRPSTLFNRTKFWEYKNEKLPKSEDPHLQPTKMDKETIDRSQKIWEYRQGLNKKYAPKMGKATSPEEVDDIKAEIDEQVATYSQEI